MHLLSTQVTNEINCAYCRDRSVYHNANAELNQSDSFPQYQSPSCLQSDPSLSERIESIHLTKTPIKARSDSQLLNRPIAHRTNNHNKHLTNENKEEKKVLLSLHKSTSFFSSLRVTHASRHSLQSIIKMILVMKSVHERDDLPFIKTFETHKCLGSLQRISRITFFFIHQLINHNDPIQSLLIP